MVESVIDVAERQRIGAEKALGAFCCNYNPLELRFYVAAIREALLLLNGGASFEDVRDNFLARAAGHTKSLRKFINYHLFSKSMDFRIQTLKENLLMVERVLCDLEKSGEPLAYTDSAGKHPAPKTRAQVKHIRALQHDAAMYWYARSRYAALTADERKEARNNNTFSIDVLSNFRGKCAVSGMYHRIEAAHIVPFRMTGDNYPGNGIALTHFLHSAFDDYLFSINPITLKLAVAPVFRSVLAFDGAKIRLPQYVPLKAESLDFHYETFREVHGIR